MELFINYIKQVKDRCGVTIDIIIVVQEDEVTVIIRKTTKISLDNYWDKLDEYYCKYDNSPAYPTTIILHPDLK